jgi:two-component system response regulator DesR
MDGLTAAAALHEAVPDCRILVLTGLSQPGLLLRGLQAHVRGRPQPHRRGTDRA